MTQLQSGPTPVVPLINGEVPALPEQVVMVRHAISAFAAQNGASGRVLAHISLAVSEGLTNVVHHAYRPGEEGRIEYAADVEDGTLEIVIADEGEGIRPGTSDGHGLGLQLVAGMSADFEIRQRLPRGTELWMSFLLDT